VNTIDYSALGRAQAEYKALGYQPVEVPWRVSTGILDVTRPPLSRGDYVIAGTDKGLIASGEQGFMTLMNKGILPPGKYQTITPCFRNEPYDETHSKQFMKLELIEIIEGQQVFDELALELANTALAVMSKVDHLIGPYLEIEEQFPEDRLLISRAYDVNFVCRGKVELGSFGVRRAFFGSWVYGTGLAEPRFSKCAANLRVHPELTSTRVPPSA